MSSSSESGRSSGSEAGIGSRGVMARLSSLVRVGIAATWASVPSSSAASGPAAGRFAGHRIRESAARGLADRRPPVWVFIHSHLNPQSATGIRARQGRAGT